jgi:general secretion pathway protein G
MTSTRRGVTPGVKVPAISLAVVAIFASFAGCVRAEYGTKRTAAHTQIITFMTALAAYKLDTGAFPTTEQGLEALREKPESVKGWQGPYVLKDIPKDPWKNDYVYKFPGDHGDQPDIISYGRDGKPGGEGDDADIVSWKNH